MSGVEGGLKSALLVAQDYSTTFRRRECAGMTQEQNLRQLLMRFKYETRLFNEVEKEIAPRVRRGLLDRFDLLVIDLNQWSSDSAVLLAEAIEKGLPCLFVADPDFQVSDDIEKFILSWSSAGVFFASCADSLSTVLDTLERYWLAAALDSWRRILKHYGIMDPNALELLVSLLRGLLDTLAELTRQPRARPHLEV